MPADTPVTTAPALPGGYGRATPTDTASPFNANYFMIKQMLSRISTAKPVQVVAVQGGGLDRPGTVDVQILVNQIDGVGGSEPHGTIYSIPYTRNQGGGNAIINDPKVGDVGLMTCADRDISSVKANNGEVSNPGSLRQFDPADGVYHPGMLNEKPDQYIFFKPDGLLIVDKNGNTISMRPTGVVIIACGNTFVMDVNDGITMTPTNGIVKVVGSIEATGEITGNSNSALTSVGLTTHTHSQGNDSHGDTEAPTNPPTVGT